MCGELAVQCKTAHSLKDQVLESKRRGRWRGLRFRGRVYAASDAGLITEETEAARLMDIADFISGVGTDVDEFFRPNWAETKGTLTPIGSDFASG